MFIIQSFPMKNLLNYLIISAFCISCKSGSTVERDFKTVSVDTVLNDNISIRALLVDKDKIWYAGDKSRVGYYDFKTLVHLQKTIADTDEKLEFRSIAQNSNAIFIANIGNPAYIFKVNKSDARFMKVYSENNEKAFYDSMNFWNEKEGIAIGDPTENCLSVLITRDAGKTWKKVNCGRLPAVAAGEAAFAASNTNICVKGSNTWLVSGGTKSRVFYSPDKGNTWEVFETPIIQGKEMTGIFSADFYNNKIGVIAGGNYGAQFMNTQNKAITYDGGKTWKLIADKAGFGYASCIQFVPNSNGKQLVAIATPGLYYSSDSGNNWKLLLDDNSLYTIRFLDENTAFAAGKNKIIRIEFKK